jgi:hypothetical protein
MCRRCFVQKCWQHTARFVPWWSGSHFARALPASQHQHPNRSCTICAVFSSHTHLPKSNHQVLQQPPNIESTGTAHVKTTRRKLTNNRASDDHTGGRDTAKLLRWARRNSYPIADSIAAVSSRQQQRRTILLFLSKLG